MISITPFAASSLRQMVVERVAKSANSGDRASVDSLIPAAAGHSRAEGSDEASSVCDQPPVSSFGDHRVGLRITVEKGGCAGMQYTMELDQWRPADEVNEADGVCVFIDPQSASFIEGSELDYCDDLVGTGFRLRNPKATRSCGCGTSFEPVQGEPANASEISGS